VGVTASIVCADCLVEAPWIGSSGHIGFPSLDDAAYAYDFFASFEYIYRGFAAIDLLPVELEAFRAFLVAHRGHRMVLAYDGMDRVTGEPTSIVAATAFHFDDRRFVEGFYQLSCEACALWWRSLRPLQLRASTRRILTDAEIDAFFRRVMDVERRGLNFHRVFGLLDQRTDDGLRSFLVAHGRHRLTVETITPPPLPTGSA
jgi:hypothetical protein